MPDQLNVLGGPLELCCRDPITGFFRDGHCRTSAEDVGQHTVCARVTEAFLTYTAAHGNDLSTPGPQVGFPGLSPGDQWCVCAGRWHEAWMDGVAPPVVLESTHESAVRTVPLEILRQHAWSGEAGETGEGS